jgi:hypothetical protein
MENCKRGEKEAFQRKRKCETEYNRLQEGKKTLQKAVDSSHSLIGEANRRLSKAIESNNMAEIHTVQPESRILRNLRRTPQNGPMRCRTILFIFFKII